MEPRRLTTKAMLLTADAVLHLAVLAWFVAGRAPEQPTTRMPGADLATFDLSAAQPTVTPARAAPPPRAQSARPAVQAALAPSSTTPPPLSVEQQVIAILGSRAEPALVAAVAAMPVSAGASADSCDLTIPVQSALRAAPDMLASALRLPRSSLSIANAYMLWNAGWVMPRQAPAATLAALQTIVAAQIAAAPAECRDAVQTGPRFIVVGPQSAPLTLVIGSGTWRWGDLLNPQAGVLQEDRKNTPAATT